jgi:hypothetical protein
MPGLAVHMHELIASFQGLADEISACSSFLKLELLWLVSGEIVYGRETGHLTDNVMA